VSTFYHFFSLKPKGEHTFVVCIRMACYVAGGFGLVEKLEHRCAKAGQTMEDGKVSVETARCIGSCGLAPAVVYDGNAPGAGHNQGLGCGTRQNRCAMTAEELRDKQTEEQARQQALERILCCTAAGCLSCGADGGILHG
jgi:hypothetical protein